jgi:SAM-dependent methyltransferase
VRAPITALDLTWPETPDPLSLSPPKDLSAIGPSAEASMQSYYAARAPEYDSVYRKLERQPDLRSIEGWLPPRFTGETVLEIACGTGYWTQFIAPSAARIVAVDLAPETLRIAFSKTSQAKPNCRRRSWASASQAPSPGGRTTRPLSMWSDTEKFSPCGRADLAASAALRAIGGTIVQLHGPTPCGCSHLDS